MCSAIRHVLALARNKHNGYRKCKCLLPATLGNFRTHQYLHSTAQNVKLCQTVLYIFIRQATRLPSYVSNSSVRSCGKQPYYIDGSIGKWTPPHILCLAGRPQFISVVAFSVCAVQHWHMRYTVQSAMHSSRNWSARWGEMLVQVKLPTLNSYSHI